MRKISIYLGMLVLIAVTSAAQNNDEKGQRHERLDFVVKELDGTKVVNSRAYSAIVEVAPASSGVSIRARSRVPVAVSSSQWQNVDVGINIDTAKACEIEAGLAVHVSAEIDDFAPSEENAAAAIKMPITRQMKWASDVIVPLRKPTTIFSSDDPNSKHKMQLELTATPIS